jgi:hypothetical protein
MYKGRHTARKMFTNAFGYFGRENVLPAGTKINQIKQNKIYVWLATLDAASQNITRKSGVIKQRIKICEANKIF